MFSSPVERLETLQNRVNDKWVVLIAHSDQVTMALQISRWILRAISFCHINADWASWESFHNFVKLEVLERKDTQVSVVASCNNPVLFSIVSNSDRDQVIDLSTVEPQDHIWVDLVNLMLVVTNNVVETSLRVDTWLDCNAVPVFRIIDLWVNQSQIVHLLLAARTLDVSLLVRCLIERIKVEAFNRLLQDLDDLLPLVHLNELVPLYY